MHIVQLEFITTLKFYTNTTTKIFTVKLLDAAHTKILSGLMEPYKKYDHFYEIYGSAMKKI